MKKTTENNYNVSKDYDLLHSLIVNLKLMVVCFVNYSYFNDNEIDRDIAIIRVNGNRYQIGVRGTGYDGCIEVPNKSKFIKNCENLNLTFIKPKKTYKLNQVFNSFNLGIQLSYFKNKSQRLELEKLEMANEILKLRAKLIEKGESK